MYIYVGNFPQETTEQDLQSIFEPFGRISSVKVITDPISRLTLGFGFIDMPDAAEGDRAVEALNLTKIKGRTVIVARTKDRVDRRITVPQLTL